MSSESSSETDFEVNTSELAASLLDAYERLDVSVRRYALFVLAPSAAFFVLTLVGALALELPLFVRLPIPVFGALVVGAGVFYPQLRVSQQKVRMENQYHLLMTHMTVLSTTNIDRMEVFRELSKEREYGPLADEVNRIVQLVDTWNQSLDDACRRRAKQIPSEPLADFFDRLAYTLGAGQSLSDFLLSEQEVMLQNYVTVYESALDNLEVMKDLYMSMILSMTFALVFAIVLPILTGTNPMLTISGVIVMFMLIQTGFLLVIRTMAPFDPIWYEPEDITPPDERRMQASVVAGGALSLVTIGLVASSLFGGPIDLADFLPVDSVPTPLYAALPFTPLLIPGQTFRRQEREIVARDEGFPGFIRALGASESAKQTTTTDVLWTLRNKDFGPLTEDIDDLFKRLNMRIEPTRAWEYFAASAQSYLIQKFSEMYLVGRQMGGEPKQLGELISENMNTVNQLRQQRRQATITLVGLLYGITAASTFAFFIGFTIVKILADLSFGLGAQSTFDVGQLIHTEVYDLPVIQFLLIAVILFNALMSSLMIRTVDGGHKLNALTHFVALTWLGCIIGVVTKLMVEGLLNV
ncbi:archaellar assembly protein FlaJ [Salinirarus marinus]|uniref:archaellar assembly protein FlaJ n=1 Tax=Salinirarus marinus TaxID=3068310 RepID=UPI003C6BF411